ncbi:MAG: hypothetical protein MJB57_01680 [Gemmatimonadetes bacterium]|nr:hypothetical protein [Gemmatimonadota bacterium]
MSDSVAGPRSERGELVPSRWMLIRDAAVFQLKLVVDGLRDMVMVPISLGVAVFDLLGVGPRAGRQFYDLLGFGRKTEGWINLFGAADHADALTTEPRPGIDALVHRMERLVIQEYERGGITTSAKKSVDRALDALTSRGMYESDDLRGRS